LVGLGLSSKYSVYCVWRA